MDIPFLGEIPINIAIRVAGDEGTPVANFEKTNDATRESIMAFVRNLAGQVSIKNASQSAPVELKIT